MGPQEYKRGRCASLTDHGCRGAAGYTFLVLDWLPWTTLGLCRECCKFTNPELIQAVEKGVYRLSSELVAD